MKKYVIGIDVGGTKILYGVFDNRMNLLRVIQRATDQELTPDQMMRQMTSNVQELLRGRISGPRKCGASARPSPLTSILTGDLCWKPAIFPN